MSGPLFVWAAVVKAEVRVSVDWVTTLILTFGWDFSYSATWPFSQLFAPGASLSAQYQYVKLALLGSSPDLAVFDAAPATNTAALRTTATPRTTRTCFSAILPPLLDHFDPGGQSSLPTPSTGVNSAYCLERRLGQHLAAVDDQRLAGDVAGLGRGEEPDRPADLLRFGITAHRDRCEHPLLVLVARVGEARRADVPGHDGVDRDAASRQLDRGRAHEPEHRRLRGAVVGEARLSGDWAGDRRRQDDPAVAAADHR